MSWITMEIVFLYQTSFDFISIKTTEDVKICGKI